MGENLNEWIRRMLQEKGWSMREFCRRSGLSSGYASEVISGKVNPGPKFYQGVVKAFDLTLTQVERLDQEGIEPESINDAPLSLREAWEIMSQLTVKQQWEVLRYMRYLMTLSDDESDEFVFDDENIGDEEGDEKPAKL